MTVNDIKRILVVGAGQMGSQIAMQAALHGYQVTLNDLSMEIIEKAMKLNRGHLERRVAKGQMTRDAMEAAIGRVRLEPISKRRPAIPTSSSKRSSSASRPSGSALPSWTASAHPTRF